MKSTSNDSALAMERRVLQVLCQAACGGSQRAHARRILQGYRWRGPSYQVIFEVLMTLPSDHPGTVQDQLVARLTRRGFPDLACEDLFQRHGLSQAEAEKLMQKLRNSQ